MAMNLEGYEFEYICEIKPMSDECGKITQLMPQSRYRNLRNLPLNAYGSGPFCKFVISHPRQKSGVYALMEGDELRYIGECVDLAKRFNSGYGNISPKNCFRGGQETNCRVNCLLYSSFSEGKRIALWFFSTSDHKSVESYLRTRLNPVWNRC